MGFHCEPSIVPPVFILRKLFLFCSKFPSSWHRFNLTPSVLHAVWCLLMFYLEVTFCFAEKQVHGCKSFTQVKQKKIYCLYFLISQKLYRSSVSNIVNNIYYRIVLSLGVMQHWVAFILSSSSLPSCCNQEGNCGGSTFQKKYEPQMVHPFGKNHSCHLT